jgi:ABC-type Na+ efflux pump permease subunit
VVQRELRETARRPLNHALRLGGAFAGVVMFWSVTARVPETVVGTELFNNIHLLLLCLICGLVPALTADCIARERREGTLGLLFMTPLTASGIVVGKVVAQVLRALTLWLALMPLLAIPFLYGGVTWANIAAFLTIELCAGMLCLAAGVLASSLTDNRALAFILAFLLTGAFVVGGRQYQKNRTPLTIYGGPSVPYPSGSPKRVWVIPHGTALNLRSSQFRIWNAATGVPIRFVSSQPPPSVLAEEFFLAALILLISIRFAGYCVERSWQDKVPSVRQKAWGRRYCSPLFENSFARSMRRTLEWNPIAWLQQYSWKARCSKWGLCLLFVVLECLTIDGSDLNAFGQLLMVLLVILVAAYTYAGVNGFLQEKKSGALELILVSPISVDQIILGRVWGLWKQFLPSALVLVGSDIAFHVAIGQQGYYYGGSWVNARGGVHWMIDFEVLAIYLTLPMIATCLALTSKNLFVASALTVAIVFGPAALVLFPGFGPAALMSFHLTWVLEWPLDLLLALAAFPITVLTIHVYSATMAFRYLQRILRRRTYAY